MAYSSFKAHSKQRAISRLRAPTTFSSPCARHVKKPTLRKITRSQQRVRLHGQ